MQPHNLSPASAEHATEFFLESLLGEMWVETSRGRMDIPLAALCKRLDVRMSTLQRHLTGLAEHGLVETACDEAGRWTARLTSGGCHLFDQAA